MTFAEKIKTLRKERGLTQLQLSAVTNVSLAVIAGIESGRRNPSKEVAKRLSEYFGVPLETFILEEVPITETAAKSVDMGTVLMISDIVAEYLAKHGYEITQDQRAALIDHFYQQNMTEPEKIDEMLSVMAALQFRKK